MRIEQVFGVKQAGSSLRTELIGGITTFLAMSYILFVNPSVLGETGMDKGALISATALASFVGTLLAGAWGRVPFAMAPGMGLNAFFTYTLVLGEGLPWQTALAVVFLSGVFFLLLTLVGLREKIAEAIPLSLKLACGGGIGLFIAFIGLKNMGLVTGREATLLGMGPFTSELLIGLAGLLLILVLDQYRVKGAILLGILVSTLLAVGLGLVAWPSEVLSKPPSLAPIALQLDLGAALRWSMVASIFSFMFVDLLDSIGTIVACAQEAGMVEKDGKIKRMGKVLTADALATTVGALLGTSTTTTYIESGTGIAAGARTGLASVATAVLFLLALFFTPIIAMVPAYATAPSLIVVGIYMLKHIRLIPFEDIGDYAPAFLTLVLMPLTHSISIGLSFGFVSYLALAMLAGRAKQQPVLLWIIGLLALINLMTQGH